MTYATSLLLLAGLYLLILASPGPNFFILSQLALDGRHREARHVVFGITTGSITWAVLALAGLATLLAQYSWLASAVRLLGAAYLIWYGGRLLLSAAAPAPARTLDAAAPCTRHTPLVAYRTGLLTNLTNPKGAAFWTSVFAAAFPAHAPAWLYPATVLLVTAMSLAWHLGITLLFASRPLRAGYLRIERLINGVAGSVLVGLGLHRMVAR
ncbi:lysine transporter LysE [Oxalobacteraceae bacterium OM1]|nr:lysine transporter LysE [Oxalobacteraceae bacterium OM1]